jgi:hypothetical protein
MINDHSRRDRPHRTFALSPRWRWLTATTLAVGGGTTAAMLLQEEATLLELLGPVAAIPLLGAPIVWLVRNLFNQTAPPIDRPGTIDKGHS